MRRLFILATDENLFHPGLFEAILATMPPTWTLVGAAMARSRDTAWKSAQRVLRLGGISGVALLASHVAARQLSARLNGPRQLHVRDVLANYGTEPMDIRTPNAPEFVRQLSGLEPDVVFSAVPHILRKSTLDVPRLACVNRHAGKLPHYRGVEPVFQALRCGERSVWVSYHTMTEQIDAGCLLWEHEEPVGPRDTVFTLYDRLFRAAGAGFWPAVERLEQGQGHPVDVSRGNYFTWPTDVQVEEFRRRGRRYI